MAAPYFKSDSFIARRYDIPFRRVCPFLCHFDVHRLNIANANDATAWQGDTFSGIKHRATINEDFLLRDNIFKKKLAVLTKTIKPR